MSSIGRRITKPNAIVSVEWNDENLKRMFEELHPDQQHKFHVNAFRVTGNKLKKMVQADAKTMGLATQATKDDEGWTWQTFGRLPRSIRVGKVWRNGNITTVRVFTQTAKKYGFMNRAPHGNIIVAGYEQRIPKAGVSGSKTTIASGEVKAGRAVYNRAKASAPYLFRGAVEASIQRMIKRINKKYT